MCREAFAVATTELHPFRSMRFKKFYDSLSESMIFSSSKELDGVQQILQNRNTSPPYPDEYIF